MIISTNRIFRSFAGAIGIVFSSLAVSPALAQGLTETEKLGEAMNALAAHKISVAEFYVAEGEWPSSGEAGLDQIDVNPVSPSNYLSAVTLGENGQIIATVANVVAGVNGGVVAVTPVASDTGITFSCTSADIASIYLPDGCTSTSQAAPKATLRLACSEPYDCQMRLIGIRGLTDGDWYDFQFSLNGGSPITATEAEIVFAKTGMHDLRWYGTTEAGEEYLHQRFVRVAHNRMPQVFDRNVRRLNPRERFFPRGRSGDAFKKGDLLYYKLIARTDGTRVGVQMRHANGRWYSISSLKSLPVRNGSAVARLRIPQAGRYRIVVWGGPQLGLATGFFLESTATPLR